MANEPIFIQINGAQGRVWEGFCVGENSLKVVSREFKWAQISEVAQGDEVKVV